MIQDVASIYANRAYLAIVIDVAVNVLDLYDWISQFRPNAFRKKKCHDHMTLFWRCPDRNRPTGNGVDCFG